MADNIIPDFNTIWASKSPLKLYDFTDAEILEGWNIIGPIPPDRSMFDAWMNRADRKMKWMYENMFSEDAMAGYLFWRFKNNAYFLGEKVSLQQEYPTIYLECIVAGETSGEDMLKLPEGKNVGDTIVDGTVQWVVKQNASMEDVDESILGHNKSETAHPDIDFVKFLSFADDGLHYRMRNGSADKVIDIVSVGDIAFRYKLSPGWVKLNGATVKRSDYPRLVQFATDNGLWTSTPGSNPQLFGQGDGSTTMVLPDYRNRVIQGGDTVGVKSAGLPNITGCGYDDAGPNGTFSGYLSASSGAIFLKSYSTSRSLAQYSKVYTVSDHGSISFDASRSNSIYGNSTTVQPPAIVLIPQIKY